MTPEHTEKLFGDIAEFIAESRALLDQGALMELAGLEDRVKSLCETVLTLSQEERLRYAERLQRLLTDLGGLGQALSHKRDAVATEMRGVAGHRKANAAYRQTDAVDSHTKKEE